MKKRKGRPLHGWLVLDKPAGITSTQAMNKVKWLLQAQKMGHGGTLDPLATGILPLALGNATKTVAYAMEGEKHYSFRVKWGEARTTDDAEGEVTDVSAVRPDVVAIQKALPAFQGLISQIPPAFSALKVEGQRAYDLARDGVKVDLKPRNVMIERFDFVGCPDADHADFEVVCGKGTYVRSLARDLAKALETVGHVTTLRRLRVGSFTLDQAVTLEQIEQEGAEEILKRLLPVETALKGLLWIPVNEAQAMDLRHGKMPVLTLAPLKNGQVFLTTSKNQPVTLMQKEGEVAKILRVL